MLFVCAGQASLFSLSSDNAVIQMFSKGGPRIMESQVGFQYIPFEVKASTPVDCQHRPHPACFLARIGQSIEVLSWPAALCSFTSFAPEIARS